MRQTNCDHSKGIDTQPGWYLYSYDAPPGQFDNFMHIYYDMIEWLYSAIGKCERHAVWGIITDENKMFFKFRYERDFLMFMLRWA